MMDTRQARLAELREQCPGWFFCGSSISPRWRAVPAPHYIISAWEARSLPHWLGAESPAELLELVKERYGWHDTCESCGVLARECGHRQPEREHGD